MNWEFGEEFKEVISDVGRILDKSYFEKMLFAHEVSEDAMIRERLKKWITVFYQLFLINIDACRLEDKSKEILKDLEKKLNHDKIVIILDKLVSTLNVLDSNVARRVLFEDFILSI